MTDQLDIQISEQPLKVETCYNFVRDHGAGGNALFVGTVRDQTKGEAVTKLDFEAYKPMAIKEMTKIALSITEQWSAMKVSIHHRVGTCNLGDIAVVIAVSTPHRAAAFEACQYAIDTLKETVPIWKKEYLESGEVWVAATP